MKVTFEERGHFLVGRALGPSLDVGNARLFKDAVQAAVGTEPRALVLDLSAVSETDSAGLGAIVSVLKWTRRFGGSLRLCCLQGPVRQVIELTRLHRILPLHQTLDEALGVDAELASRP